jgi:hypothetical protein
MSKEETMRLDELIEAGKRTIKNREEDAEALGLGPDFMEGFREGVATVP